MVYASSTELADEFLYAERFEVVDEERPKVEDVVTGEAASLLHEVHFSSEQNRLDGSTKPHWSRPDDKNARPTTCVLLFILLQSGSLVKQLEQRTRLVVRWQSLL